MNELTVRTNNLPDNLKDLTQFVLVGREKLVSVRAEIRAIDKLNLAQEVRDQKKEECSMLSEALLDAEVKLGDLLKLIPKAPAGRPQKKEIIDTAVGDFKIEKPKPKHEVIKDLGFNQKQAERFETLSNNKDLVEAVKQEARENDDIPTRTRVLELAKARKQKEQEEQKKEENYNQHLDECKKISYQFHDTLYALDNLEIDFEKLSCWGELLDSNIVNDYFDIASESISKLIKIRNFLQEVKKNV